MKASAPRTSLCGGARLLGQNAPMGARDGRILPERQRESNGMAPLHDHFTIDEPPNAIRSGALYWIERGLGVDKCADVRNNLRKVKSGKNSGIDVAQ